MPGTGDRRSRSRPDSRRRFQPGLSDARLIDVCTRRIIEGPAARCAALAGRSPGAVARDADRPRASRRRIARRRLACAHLNETVYFPPGVGELQFAMPLLARPP